MKIQIKEVAPSFQIFLEIFHLLASNENPPPGEGRHAEKTAQVFPECQLIFVSAFLDFSQPSFLSAHRIMCNEGLNSTAGYGATTGLL